MLNLIRKEVRLLRPLWMIAGLIVLSWTYLLAFHLVPLPGTNQNVSIVFILVTMCSLLVAVLAGSLSLGEERTSGTHAWQLTLPISAFRQWLIKLVTAIVLAEVCGVVLPLLVLVAGGSISGSPFMFVDPSGELSMLLAALILTFAAFWCACGVNGTVRAALCVFPTLGIIAVTGGLAGRLGPLLARALVSTFDVFASLKFTYAVSNVGLHWEIPALIGCLFFLPILLFALAQSYRLFRTQFQDSTARFVRQLLPVALIAIVCLSTLGAFSELILQAMQERYMFFGETRQAIKKILVDAQSFDAAHPLQLTSDDLARVSPLSQRTRQWLANSTITIAPDRPPEYWTTNSALGNTSWDLVTIHFQNGFQCMVSFPAVNIPLAPSRLACK